MNYSIEQGWLREARRVPSPNYGPRPSGCAPDLLVIHNISLPPRCYGGDCIERFFTNSLDWDEHPYFDEIRGMQVSAHLLIQRSGAVLQFVNFNDRAWHAGDSSFEGRGNCNDFSIGIELEGSDEDPYSVLLIAHYPGLSARNIAGHSEIAPGRKTDPGPAFDWQRYRAQLEKESPV